MNAFEALGNTLNSRMSAVSGGAVGVYLELGTITSSLSLQVSRFADAIPKGEYMVDIRIYSPTYLTSKESHSHSGGSHGGHTGGSGEHSHNDGEHNHKLPDCFRKIKAGDRVLVAWVGTEPIVVAIVQSS